MRVIIAGSRHLAPSLDIMGFAIEDYQYKFGVGPSVILSGRCRGPDQIGEQWANKNNIPIEYYPAEWDRYGKGAGFIRNREMAQRANGLILMWDGISPGSHSMLKLAEQFKLLIVQWIGNK